MRARGIFIAVLLVALPGLLWQAFEMYGLTLGGERMLFFSIVHTMPLAVLLVVLAVPAGLLVLAQATAGYIWSSYASRLGLTRRAAAILIAFMVMHFAALASYELWAPTEYLRIAVCTFGIALCALSVLSTAVSLSNPFRAPTR